MNYTGVRQNDCNVYAYYEAVYHFNQGFRVSVAQRGVTRFSQV